MELAELKPRILKLLKEDEEFRYAVAGLIGLDELLKKLDRHEEELVRLREDMVAGFRRHDEILERHAQELARLREDMNKGFERHGQEIAKLREDMVEGFRRHDEEIAKLREDMNKALQTIDRRFEAVDRRLTRVERTLEKLTVDVEDEARSIVRYRLKTELGLDIELEPLVLPELELNIYGSANDVCVVGEATVRGGVSVLRDLLKKIELLRVKHPDRLRPKLITVIYSCLALPELVDEARKRDVWVLKATQDYCKPDLTKL